MELLPILEDAFGRLGYVTSRKLQHAMGISRQAVWARMRPLVDAGVVRVEGIGKGVRYRPGRRGECPHGAPRSVAFWSSIERRFPELAHVVIRSGPGTRLRRHAHAVLFPPAVSADFIVLDFDGVERVWPAYARACMVELPRLGARVQPINAAPEILTALEQAIRAEELRPRPD